METYHVNHVEAWDEEEDSPAGECHVWGSTADPAEAREMVRQADAEGLIGGWPGSAVVTDDEGRRADLAMIAAAC